MLMLDVLLLVLLLFFEDVFGFGDKFGVACKVFGDSEESAFRMRTASKLAQV